MANRFWVGGGSSTNWSATGNTNWATTSGGANNASVPTTTDVAIFDSNSGTGNSVISTSITIQGLDCTGGTGDYAGTLTQNNAAALTINTGAANSLRFSAGMTYSPANASSSITFAHTSGTASLTSNGKLFPALNINGLGGTTALVDDLFVNRTAGATLNVLAGTFDANGKNVTASIFSSTGSVVRTVTMGSGLWTVGVNTTTATANVWSFNGATNLTFNKNTANIKITGSTVTNRTFIGNGLTFNDLTIEANSSDGIISITGANTFGAITITGRCALVLPATVTTTATSLSATGTPGAPVMLVSSTIGTPATLSIASGTTTLAWGSLRDITGSGGANFNATSTLNFGGNTGWTIANPSDAASPASIATAVWQDATAGDFTTAGSIGRDLKSGGGLVGATNLGKTTNAICRGTVGSSASTTSIPTSAFSPAGAVADQFKNRAVLFDADTTTTALRGQVASITASSNSATPTLTVSALTTAPASGDTFSVI